MGYALGGFVAGDGCFSVADRKVPGINGRPRLRFRFSVKLVEHDRPLLEALANFIGCGTVRPVARVRQPTWQPQVVLTVDRATSLVERVVPFGERYLLPSRKRIQFERWRHQLVDYLAHPHRVPGTCSIPGCERPIRGRGLCRSHYYRATGY